MDAADGVKPKNGRGVKLFFGFLDRSDSIQGLTPAEQLENYLVFFLVRGEC